MKKVYEISYKKISTLLDELDKFDTQFQKLIENYDGYRYNMTINNKDDQETWSARVEVIKDEK